MELSDKLPASVANPQEETRYPFSRRLRGLEPVSTMSRRENIFPVSGFELWSVQSVILVTVTVEISRVLGEIRPKF